ncbi:helix-turn-helix domain-containing protein [Gandjariella thermophila]|uniref:Transcriptional regulator n=1 Tax=Gandjariella thermophila TaxID=1931992 RepID=A0A4D4JC65_9PSEU|nr:helix-turn-helix transcriptional regulator [Gandjariella thermophila]GDY31959.1 transcriptional regulator [Gandjariella thermophila]
MSVAGPTARRRRLGATLVEMRDAANKTQRDAADLLGCSVGKIVNIEKGRSGVKKAELEKLLEFYGTDPEQQQVLEELRKAGARRGWWSTYGLPDWVKPFVGFENDASSVRNFELGIIPGLLQTEPYARAVHLTARHLAPPGTVDKRVAARMERQRRLTATPPLELWAVVDEAALHRMVGGPEVMTEQLEHLLRMGQLPNVKIQVLPADVGAHGSMSGPICVFSFADAAEPDIGWLEHPLGGNIVDDPKDVATMATLFDDLREAALGVRESARFIAAMVNERGGGGEHA